MLNMFKKVHLSKNVDSLFYNLLQGSLESYQQ